MPNIKSVRNAGNEKILSPPARSGESLCDHTYKNAQFENKYEKKTLPSNFSSTEEIRVGSKSYSGTGKLSF